MISLPKSVSYNNGVPVLKAKDIELLANKHLKEFDKHIFDDFKALDVDKFIESYLGLNVEYQKLSLDDTILGKTPLFDGAIPIISDDNKKEIRLVKKGTIFVDLDACGCENRIRFTMIHEACHAVFHQNVERSVLENCRCCNETITTIDKHGCLTILKAKSQLEWMEYQADKYASCILMPRQCVRKMYEAKHKEYFENKRITSARPNRLWKILYDMSEAFQVSKPAMALRLKTLNLISGDQYKSLKINMEKKGELL